MSARRPIEQSEPELKIRVLPAHWAPTTLDALLIPLHDGRLLHHGWSPQCEAGPSQCDEEWAVLKTTAIQDGAFLSEHNKRLPNQLTPRPHLEVKVGDLIITCAGPRARCGVPCLVRCTRPRLMLSGKMYRFRVPEGIVDPRYIECWLRTTSAQAAIDRMKTGISDSGLNLTHSRFLRLPVPMAPFAEQHRIVEAIESYFTRLDDAGRTLERVQRNLKRYRAAVLTTALEGRLVPTEAELAHADGRYYEPASVLLDRILSERRRRWHEAGSRGKYPDPVAPEMADLPSLPEGWCWATLDALAWGFQNGVYVPKSQYGAGVPILRIDDYQADWSRSSDELQRVEIPDSDADKYGLSVGDLVVNRVNSPSHLGKSLAVLDRHLPAVFESNMMRFRLASGVLPEFIQHYVSSAAGKARMTQNAKWAVNQASINQADVAGTSVPLPPVAEQRRIVAEVERLLSTGIVVAHIARTGAAHCGRLRQSILQSAFDGRLVNQGPNDEPAAVLLDRIKRERLTGWHPGARMTRNT